MGGVVKPKLKALLPWGLCINCQFGNQQSISEAILIFSRNVGAPGNVTRRMGENHLLPVFKLIHVAQMKVATCLNK